MAATCPEADNGAREFLDGHYGSTNDHGNNERGSSQHWRESRNHLSLTPLPLCFTSFDRVLCSRRSNKRELAHRNTIEHKVLRGLNWTIFHSFLLWICSSFLQASWPPQFYSQAIVISNMREHVWKDSRGIQKWLGYIGRLCLSMRRVLSPIRSKLNRLIPMDFNLIIHSDSISISWSYFNFSTDTMRWIQRLGWTRERNMGERMLDGFHKASRTFPEHPASTLSWVTDGCQYGHKLLGT